MAFNIHVRRSHVLMGIGALDNPIEETTAKKARWGRAAKLHGPVDENVWLPVSREH
ncbi:hypothetical protein ABT282_08800 [Streptomyces sp. NPDC000927]|uniref:hypothetical protein n=1 Tax=Streptomyces sp. NPDC000927 TaxID=3154371 RepID=UPI003333A906